MADCAVVNCDLCAALEAGSVDTARVTGQRAVEDRYCRRCHKSRVEDAGSGVVADNAVGNCQGSVGRSLAISNVREPG